MNYYIKPFKTIRGVDRYKIVFPNTNFLWDNVFDTKEECWVYARQVEKEKNIFKNLYKAVEGCTQRVVASLR